MYKLRVTTQTLFQPRREMLGLMYLKKNYWFSYGEDRAWYASLGQFIVRQIKSNYLVKTIIDINMNFIDFQLIVTKILQ